jgi:hypothetical protein
MKRSTVISLLDVVLVVQREVALYQASKRNPRNPESVIDPGWRSYDSSAFMRAILKDVFDNTVEEHPSEYLVLAKSILQNTGMSHLAAHQLCNRVFDLIVDYIGAHLPYLRLQDASKEVHADMIGAWDVMVTEFVH